MSYFEGTNHQAKREDEGKKMFDAHKPKKFIVVSPKGEIIDESDDEMDLEVHYMVAIEFHGYKVIRNDKRQ